MFIKSAFSYNYVNNYSRAMQYIMISFLLLTNFCFSSSNIYFPFSIWVSCPRTFYPFKAICMYWLLFRLTAQPSPWNFSNLCHLKIFCALLRYWISYFPCFFFFFSPPEKGYLGSKNFMVFRFFMAEKKIFTCTFHQSFEYKNLGLKSLEVIVPLFSAF